MNPIECHKAIGQARLWRALRLAAGFSHRALAAALVFAGLVAPFAAAQTMTIRLVDAKTGKPIRDKMVSIAFYVEDPSMINSRRRVAYPDGQFWTNLAVDKEGFGAIQVPKGATIVEVGKGLDNDGTRTTEKAIHLFMCQGKPEFTKPDSGFQYGRVAEVLATGFVARDPDCQPRLKVPAAPGQFVVMAWPPSTIPLSGGIDW
ncbi:MAG: hypothetical protein WBE72_10485 [Terracidiphilus sp.]